MRRIRRPRGGLALAFFDTAQVANHPHAQADKPIAIASGEITQHARPVYLAPTHRAAIERAVAADIAEVAPAFKCDQALPREVRLGEWDSHQRLDLRTEPVALRACRFH